MSVHIADITPKTTIGKRDFKNAINTYGETVTAFFDYFLKGENNGFIETKRIRYFNIGDALARNKRMATCIQRSSVSLFKPQ